MQCCRYILPILTSLQRVRDCLLNDVLPKAKLWEFFSVDVDVIVEEFRTSVYRLNGGEHPRPEGKQLKIIQDTQYRRLGSKVDANLTLELFNIHWFVREASYVPVLLSPPLQSCSCVL